MDYLPSSYFAGVGGRAAQPFQPSYQSAPIGYGSSNTYTPTNPLEMPGAAQQEGLKGSPGANLVTPSLGGAISENQRLSALPTWASDYFNQQTAGLSSGQRNDSFSQYAPQIADLFNQYGAGFSPQGFGFDSLSGMQNTLGAAGYGLGKAGDYFAQQSQAGAVPGVSYGFDPTSKMITGNYGGAKFDVKGIPELSGGNFFDWNDTVNNLYSQYGLSAADQQAANNAIWTPFVYGQQAPQQPLAYNQTARR